MEEGHGPAAQRAGWASQGPSHRPAPWPQPWCDLAEARFHQGKYASAFAALRGYLVRRGDPSGCAFDPLNVGSSALERGLRDVAEWQFREALRRTPKSATAHLGLAGVDALVQDWAAVEQHARDALEVASPGDPEPQRVLDRAMRLGRPNDLQRPITKSESLAAGGRALLHSDLHLARIMFERALEESPSSARAHVGLANVELKLRRWTLAEVHARSAIKRADLDDPEPFWALAIALHRQNKLHAASTALRDFESRGGDLRSRIRLHPIPSTSDPEGFRSWVIEQDWPATSP